MDGAVDAAAGGEIAFYQAPFGFAGFDDVFEDAVHGVLVENAQVAVSQQIHFQGFELHALLVGAVGNGDGSMGKWGQVSTFDISRCCL